MSSTERTRGSKERTIWPVLPGLIMGPEFVEGVDVFHSLFNGIYSTAFQVDCFVFSIYKHCHRVIMSVMSIVPKKQIATKFYLTKHLKNCESFRSQFGVHTFGFGVDSHFLVGFYRFYQSFWLFEQVMWGDVWQLPLERNTLIGKKGQTGQTFLG